MFIQRPVPLVFGYNMLSNGLYGGGGIIPGVANLKLDIQDAQACGLDGFVVAAGAWTAQPNYATGMVDMFQAALELGTNFKLAISPEFISGMSAQDATDVKAIIDLYKGHANMLMLGGKPVFMDSGTVDGAWWKANVANTHRVAYFPFVYAERAGGPEERTAPTYAERETAHNAKNWSATTSNVGLFNFVFGGNAPSLATAQKDYHDLAVAKGKSFIAGVSPYYTSQKYVNDQVYTWETFGGEGIETLFLSAIQNIKPYMIVLSTWNDLGETYWSPCLPANMGLNTGRYLQMPPMHPHIGYTKLAKYYIPWIKNFTQPAITQDEVFYFYRTHPAAMTPPAFSIASMTWSGSVVTVTTTAPHAFAAGDNGVAINHAGQTPTQYRGVVECSITGASTYTFALVSNPGACTVPGTGLLTQSDFNTFNLIDSIFVTTLLTAPATLRVITGGATTDTTVGSGMVHTRVPFNTGTQIIRLIRSGSTLIDLTGEDIKSAITLYDFNPTTGYGKYP